MCLPGGTLAYEEKRPHFSEDEKGDKAMMGERANKKKPLEPRLF
jgi:hypothetical protein